MTLTHNGCELVLMMHLYSDRCICGYQVIKFYAHTLHIYWNHTHSLTPTIYEKDCHLQYNTFFKWPWKFWTRVDFHIVCIIYRISWFVYRHYDWNENHIVLQFICYRWRRCCCAQRHKSTVDKNVSFIK